MIAGTCRYCGAPATLTCRTCGAVTCATHNTAGFCIRCARRGPAVVG